MGEEQWMTGLAAPIGTIIEMITKLFKAPLGE